MTDQAPQTTPMLRNVGLGALALAVAFAFGRYTVPEKVRVETQIVEVEKKKSDTKVDEHKSTTTTVVEKPDGTKETVISDTDNTLTNTHVTDNTHLDEDKINETIRGGSHTNVSFLAGTSGTFNTGIQLSHDAIYGVAINREILGPVTVGLWATTAKQGGFSVGLNF